MNRQEYFRELTKLNAREPDEDSPEQKFKRGSRVHIAKNLGGCMKHFTNDIDAIVMYTYKQKFGSGDYKSYSLLLLDENGIGYNTTSWYEEWQLALVSNDLDSGLKLIEQYKYK